MVGKPAAIPGRGSGADDETTRRAVEGHGQEDHLVGGGRDHRRHRSDDAALARTIERAWLLRLSGSAEEQAERKACAPGDGTGSSAAVSGKLLRPEHSALPRETSRGARNRAELYMGAEGVAGGRSGGTAQEARQVSAAARTASDAGHAAAH